MRPMLSHGQCPADTNWGQFMYPVNDGGFIPLSLHSGQYLTGFFATLHLSPYGELAQLARALAWHARGHRFDSGILHR